MKKSWWQGPRHPPVWPKVHGYARPEWHVLWHLLSVTLQPWKLKDARVWSQKEVITRSPYWYIRWNTSHYTPEGSLSAKPSQAGLCLSKKPVSISLSFVLWLRCGQIASLGTSPCVLMLMRCKINESTQLLTLRGPLFHLLKLSFIERLNKFYWQRNLVFIPLICLRQSCHWSENSLLRMVAARPPATVTHVEDLIMAIPSHSTCDIFQHFVSNCVINAGF